MTKIASGDLVLLVHVKKMFLVTVTEREFHSHFGVVDLGDLVGKEYGTAVESHSGNVFTVLKPTYSDFIKKMRKMPQVIQPKDTAQILAETGISTGDTVVEGGAGSGALTVFLAAVVSPG
ncbi:MAG: tRNA methyltransferase, partial [Theionarchaea archaeon]|nr:tRNA methyltransferase [Theionarchaea archaeon]